MAEQTANFRITSVDQQLYLNSERIIGAQNVSISKNFGNGSLTYGGIGNKQVYYIPRSPQIANVSIDSYLLNKEYLLPYVTGSDSINGFILKDSQDSNPYYSLLNGYMTSYSHQYAVGQIPRISTSMTVFGNAGKILTGNLGSLAMAELDIIRTIYDNNVSNDDWGLILDSVSESEDWLTLSELITSFEDWNLDVTDRFLVTGLLVPDNGSIYLNIDTFNTNRVQSYQINVNANKLPVYNIGSRYPARVELVYPIDVTCQFTFDVGDYESIQSNSVPETQVVKDLSLTVKNYRSDDIISSYSFNNLNLISENYNTSIDGNVSVTVLYNTKIYGN